MSQKVAVAIVHGIGDQQPDFAQELIDDLNSRCHAVCGDDLIIRPVYWASVFDPAEAELIKRTQAGGPLHYMGLRDFIINFVGDAIAYQITPGDRSRYDEVHAMFADTLHELAAEAGDTAPLCVMAHSLGTIITSNYLYDLQVDPQRAIISAPVRARIGQAPLERGETLALLYTLGSPLALWSLRHHDFGVPIQMPPPNFVSHYPNLQAQWINCYDKDDIFAFPLKSLNAAYGGVVSADQEINVGNLLESWNPLSHLAYWKDTTMLNTLSDGLTRLWKAVNPA